MKSNNLPQYLLNEGIMQPEEIEALLKNVKGTELQLPLIALRRQLAEPEFLDEQKLFSTESFLQAVRQKGILTEEQIDQLSREQERPCMLFAQYLLNTGMLDYRELAVYFRDREQMQESPVHRAVGMLCGQQLAEEAPFYSSFMEIFMDSLMDFLHAPAVISVELVPEAEFADGLSIHAASQRMNGDMSIVTGILAENAKFLELACRYSEEALSEIDEMAIDSIQEFLNVINGIYSIQLAEQKVQVELEVPRWGTVVVPHGHRQLVMRVCTDFGRIYVVLAADEFIE